MGLLSFADDVAKLIKQGFPESVAKRIASGELPMDQALKATKDLNFLHNTTPQAIQRYSQMGGLPNPSLAVTRQNIPFEGFGDITLVGNPNNFDPKRAVNRVYSADAYTSRAPRPVRLAQKNAYKQVSEDFAKYKNHGYMDQLRYDLSDLETKKNINEYSYRNATDWFSNDNAALLKFADDNNIKPPMKEDGTVSYSDLYKMREDNRQLHEQWVNDQLDKYFQEDEYFISNPDRDRYASSAKLKPYTAPEVSRFMSRKGGANTESTMTHGAGNIRASTTKRFKSLDDIRSSKGLLKPAEDVAEIKQTSGMMLDDLQEALRPYYDYDPSGFSYLDSVGEMLSLSERKGLDAAMREVGFSNVPDGIIKELNDYKDYLRYAPTEYFEGKPHRPVSLREFTGAIVPDSTDQRTIDILSKYGIDVKPYKTQEERTALRKAFKDTAFTTAGAGLLGAGLLGSDDAEAGFINKGGKTLLEAWHGSPHKFDRFDLSKIGTGEGAQAYGHGLYFTDSPEVAKGYRDALEKPHTGALVIDGERVMAPPGGGTQKDEIVRRLAKEMRAYAIDNPGSDLIKDGYLPEVVDSIRNQIRLSDDDALRFLDGLNETRVQYNPQGSIYRIEADVTPEQLLDYDKPFQQQNEAVQKSLNDVFGEISEKIRSRPQIYTSPVEDVINRQTGAEIYDRVANTSAYGDWVRSQLTSGQMKMSEANTPASVSKFLNSRGVSGLRYLDGNSRRAGEGTYNYVLFDDKPISIKERGNANVGLLSGMGAVGAGAALTPGLLGEYGDYGSIQAEEYPTLQRIGEGIEAGINALPPGYRDIVPGIGLAEYLKNFGRERSTGQKALDSIWAALDFF